jgi:hypothetical protein
VADELSRQPGQDPAAGWLRRLGRFGVRMLDRLAPEDADDAETLQALAGIVGAALLVITLCSLPLGRVSAFLLVLWTIGPPMYFWFEFFRLRPLLHPDGEGLEDFKHGQELSRNIWAGVVVMLVALHYSGS